MVTSKVAPADLVDVSAIAELAKTTPGMIQNWRRRHADFPAPIAVLAVGPIWNRPDVEAWIQRPRRAGRPKKAEA
jgi:hypothetical protein